MSTFLAEFFGTMVLIILGGGVCAGVALKKTGSNDSGWIVITMGWALAVTLAVYAVGSISGAHINPAVTLALAAVGEFDWAQVPSYILAQMLGAMAGAAIVWLHYLPHWRATEDPETKLGVFSTGPSIPSRWANLLSELIGTFILIAGLLFIGANKFTEGLNPLIVGALIAAIGISLGGTTGYAINPARDLGPRIAHAILPISGKGSSNWSYAPIPVVGPILGGLLGATVYQWLFLGQTSLWLWASLALTAVVIGLAINEESGADK